MSKNDAEIAEARAAVRAAIADVRHGVEELRAEAQPKLLLRRAFTPARVGAVVGIAAVSLLAAVAVRRLFR